ncbi:diphthine synthase [Candidatus Nanohalobium constans]|uniref:Diphthine synthase n=1 Tax=Candidatus Nanohalobium constans TaxID=2565781 RepID=A0A5Q0UGR6_9ARCH|nr:diphthine synthase [Candidatus Nanohalobium constans]QGA80807.1 diphthine synthase [Candidatus Nanohalobium constans]
MIHLIGLGLDNKEATEKGLEAIKSADKAYAEFYTNTETINLERIEEKTDSSIQKLSRKEVEQEDKILEEAKDSDVAFLVSGDALTATTHYDIKHRAEEKEIETEVVHAPSIFTSIAETGLNVYKFGRTVTLPENGKPDSVIKYVEKNDEIGLHSLILLDINLEASEAAEKILEMKPEFSKREALVLERANLETQEISRMTLEEVSEKEFGEPPHCLILPGEKSHKEEEFLTRWRDW